MESDNGGGGGGGGFNAKHYVEAVKGFNKRKLPLVPKIKQRVSKRLQGKDAPIALTLADDNVEKKATVADVYVGDKPVSGELARALETGRNLFGGNIKNGLVSLVEINENDIIGDYNGIITEDTNMDMSKFVSLVDSYVLDYSTFVSRAQKGRNAQFAQSQWIPLEGNEEQKARYGVTTNAFTKVRFYKTKDGKEEDGSDAYTPGETPYVRVLLIAKTKIPKGKEVVVYRLQRQ